jgi:hypothetical protein
MQPKYHLVKEKEDKQRNLIINIHQNLNLTEVRVNKQFMKLIVKAGTYEADTLLGIIIEVLKHRFWHFRTHGKWID